MKFRDQIGRILVCSVALGALATPSLAEGEFVYRYKMAGPTDGVVLPPPPPPPPPTPVPVDPDGDIKTDDGNGNLIITVKDLTPDDYYWDDLQEETKAYVDAALVNAGRDPAVVVPRFTVQGSVPGIHYNAFTGVVSGQPTTVGTHSLIVSAWDPDPDVDGDNDQPWQKLTDITYNIEVTPNASPIRKIMNVASATQFSNSFFTTTYYDPGAPYAQSTDNFIGGFSIPDEAAAECATIDWSFTASVPQALGLTVLAKNVVRIDGEPDYGYFNGGYENTQFWYYPVKVNAVCKDTVGATKWNHRSPKFLMRVLAPA